MKVLIALLCISLIQSRKVYGLSERELRNLYKQYNVTPKDRYLLESNDFTNYKTYNNYDMGLPIHMEEWDPVEAIESQKDRKLLAEKRNKKNIKKVKAIGALKVIKKGKNRTLKHNKRKNNKKDKAQKKIALKKSENHKKKLRMLKKHRKTSNNSKNTKKLNLNKNDTTSKKEIAANQQINYQKNQSNENSNQTMLNSNDSNTIQNNIPTIDLDQQNRNLNLQMNNSNVVNPINAYNESMMNDEQMQVIQSMLKNAKSKKKVILTPSELTMIQSIAQESAPVSQEERDLAIAAGARACQGAGQQDIFYKIIQQINSNLINQKMVAAVASLAAIRMAKTPQTKYRLKIKTLKGDINAAKSEYDFKITERNARVDNINKLIDLLEATLNNMGTGMSSKVRMLNAMVLKKFNSPDMDVMLLDAH